MDALRHVYAAQTAAEMAALQSQAAPLMEPLNAYLAFLADRCQATALPRCIVWTTKDVATRLISDIPLPAYTNDFRTVMAPDPDVWRQLYLEQLDGIDAEAPIVAGIRDYYLRQLNSHHVLQILGHEFVHHSEYFPDGCSSVWLEEGMAEYISRRYFLTAQEYAAKREIERQLIRLHEKQYGRMPLSRFNESTYAEPLPRVLYAYWRSFSAAERLVEAHGGEALAVLRSLACWADSGRQKTWEEWFHLSDQSYA